MNHEIVPPRPFGRRELLLGSGFLVAGLATEAVFPRPIRALEENREKEEKTFSSVGVRRGDSIYSLCRFYGILEPEVAGNMTAIVKRNHLENPDVILPGKSLYLPISSDIADLPFKRFAFQFEGNSYASSVSMTNSRKAFEEQSNNHVLYIPDWPNVFWGHSAEVGEKTDNYPFHQLLRQLFKDPWKINVWLSRTVGGEKGTWVNCQVNKDEVQYIKGETNNDDSGRKLWGLPFNSKKIMFCTCATEMGKHDRLIAMATLHFEDAKDPPLYGLNIPVSEK